MGKELVVYVEDFLRVLRSTGQEHLNEGAKADLLINRCPNKDVKEVVSDTLKRSLFFFRHDGPPPKALHQSGLTTGEAFMASRSSPKKASIVHNSQPRVPKTLHICTRGLGEVGVHKKFAAAS